MAAAWVVWLFSVPILAIAAIFSARTRSFLTARILPFSPPFPRRGVWIHCASFGEVRAIEPIVSEVSRLGKYVNISVSTRAGLNEAQRLYPNAAARFLPFENLLPFWIKPQDALIVFEAELWLALFARAKKTGAKTALFNARVSERSMDRRRALKFFYSAVFKNIDHIYAQSEGDRRRLIELGASGAEVLGNIKLMQKPKTKLNFAKPAALVTIAASTHDGEEALILAEWIKSGIGGRIFIAPRHSDRFDGVWGEVSAIAARAGLSVSRLSGEEGLGGGLGGSAVTLADIMGVLIDLYAIADIAVLGGSFADCGGHNPIEAARFGCKIITGMHIFNQKALFGELSGVIYSGRGELAASLKSAVGGEKTRIKGAIDNDNFIAAVKTVAA